MRMKWSTALSTLCIAAAFQTEARDANPGQLPQSLPGLQTVDCWKIQSLGTLGGANSYAVDVNNSGQVAGNSETEPRIQDPADPPWTLFRGFISAPNGGPITEIVTPGYWYGTATAINNLGQVVGDTTIGRSFPIAFVTDPGGGNVQTTIAWTYVRDINNVGQTLWDIWYPYFVAAIGDNVQPDMNGTNLINVDVPVGDPYSALITAAALNDAGQVAVNVQEQAYNSLFPFRAYRWSVSGGAVAIAADAIGSRAIQMNDLGQIVGMITTKNVLGEPRVEQAFVTHRFDTSIMTLGAPGDGNTPTDINNWSQLVGTMQVGGQPHGYVTAPLNVRQTIDLDTLSEITRDGWTNLRPAAINDRGQIAGTGTLDGNNRAFLITPQSLLAYLPTRNGKQPQCYRLSR